MAIIVQPRANGYIQRYHQGYPQGVSGDVGGAGAVEARANRLLQERRRVPYCSAGFLRVVPHQPLFERSLRHDRQSYATPIHPNRCGWFRGLGRNERHSSSDSIRCRDRQAGAARRQTGSPGRLAPMAPVGRVLGTGNRRGIAQRAMVRLRRQRQGGGFRGCLRAITRRQTLRDNFQWHQRPLYRHARYGYRCGRRGDRLSLYVRRDVQHGPDAQSPAGVCRHRPV